MHKIKYTTVKTIKSTCKILVEKIVSCFFVIMRKINLMRPLSRQASNSLTPPRTTILSRWLTNFSMLLIRCSKMPSKMMIRLLQTKKRFGNSNHKYKNVVNTNHKIITFLWPT